MIPALFSGRKSKKGAEEQELVDAILDEYETDGETALNAVKAFIEKLRENEFLA